MPMNWFQRYLFSKLDAILASCQSHQLILKLPDGTIKTYGNLNDNDIEPAEISIHHFWVLRELFLKGEIGLGESFMKQYWTTPNITAVISFFIRNKSNIGTHFQPSFWVKNYMAFLHFLNRNTVKNAPINIKSHYDIGNEFYSLFLDKSKQYSSGIFKHKTATLEDAQSHKIQTILNKLALSNTHHLLEIGSGWGELAIKAAQQFGCRVTTITLSQEQADYINQRLSELSLTHLVEVKIMDFRKISETYDRIVSIEMIEAVGHGFLPVYFEKIKSALKPNGIVVIQAITYPHSEYKHYLKRSDFIRKHIFPGGHLPSLEIIKSLVSSHNLSVTSLEDITESYATTLAHWYTRFMSKVTQIKSLGFDDSFIRKWAFYFNYCEAAFRTKYLSTYQLIIRK
jgi:cyclopropane-fatty-acyl-phospholipid synthase